MPGKESNKDSKDQGGGLDPSLTSQGLIPSIEEVQKPVRPQVQARALGGHAAERVYDGDCGSHTIAGK